MLSEDRLCYCGKRWGEHYGNFCKLKDRKLHNTGIRGMAGTFMHNGAYQARNGITYGKYQTRDDITGNNPNFLFRRRKQHNVA